MKKSCKHERKSETPGTRVSRREFVNALASTAAVAWVGGSGLVFPANTHGAEGNQRPIADFLSAQGTTMVFNTPVRDQIAWFSAVAPPPVRRPPVRFALVDYCGFADEYLQSIDPSLALGTSTGGSVTERPLSDGRAEVTVILHTTSALTWALNINLSDPNFDPNAAPTDFGFRAAELALFPDLTEPALGESHLKMVFRNTSPGAPLPDLVNAFVLGNAEPGQELISLAFRSDSEGPLHASFGVPEGTPGQCVVTQTGITMSGSHGATADAFPAERVDLTALSR
jgi:hypothetical protein